MAGANQDRLSIETDHAVAELSSNCPRLRRDLKFTYHEKEGRPGYILEDLASRKYYQVGPAEFRFLRSLNGELDIREILAATAGALGKDAPGEQQIQSMLRWAIDNELLESEGSNQHGRRIEYSSDQEKKKPKKFLQEILFLKIPLGDPDPFLNSVSRFLIWTVSPAAVLAWFLILFSAGYQVVAHWRELMEAAGGAILPSNWLLLIVAFSGLKLIHEIWHGVVAKKYRAPVPEWGVRMLALITPLTYVDASSTWRFSARWPRICVAAAGMYVELLIGALAVFVWVETDPGFLNTLAYNVIFAATVVTVLFNANPLMRFDGYYILSDWLEIPNLAVKGQRYLKWASKKYLMGMREEVLSGAIRERLGVIACYGVLASIWKIVIWIGIMAIAANLFKGAGIVLVAALLLAAVFSMLARFFKFLVHESRGQRPDLAKALLRIGVVVALLFTILFLIPVSPSPKMYSVIRYPGKAVLRVEAPGFARDIQCENGQAVSEGEVLLRLENRVKTLELEKVRLDVKRAEVQARQFLEENLVSSYQAEQERLISLRERLEVIEKEVDSLTFRSPIEGVIVADRIESLQGSYLSPGQVVLTVLPRKEPELMVCIHQDDLEAVARRRSDEIQFRIRGKMEKQSALLSRSEARASTQVPHPAITALGGGPLLLRQKPEAKETREVGLAIDQLRLGEDRFGFGEISGDEEEVSLANQELVDPHLVAFAALDPEISDWKEGEWGTAKLKGGQEYRLGGWIYEKVSTYVRKQFEAARQAG